MEDGKLAEQSKKRRLARRKVQIKNEFLINNKIPPTHTVHKLQKSSDQSNYSSSTLVATAPLDSHVQKPFNCEPDICSFLATWSHKHNISHSALNDLLKALKSDHPNLPSDARTLLETPHHIDIVNCAGGSYVYFGLATKLIERASKGITSENYPLMQKKNSKDSNPLLSITINVDGLPIHSSSTNSFWPILCVLDQSPIKQPFIVALYYGESKPNNADVYLRPFVDECLHLEQNGLEVNDIQYDFRISCVIADAPARSFLKSIKSHNSLHACEKCQQEGIYRGRTIWPYLSDMQTLRTDFGFFNQQYEDHQLSKSILTELDVGLVTQVPLDYMHLVCLGIVKKMIRCWVENGPKKCKLNIHKIDEISTRLKTCRKHFPVEFSRRPRPLKLFKYWKATEFRAFLLYLGPVILKDILPNINLYKHFLLLNCAIYILCNDICRDDIWRSYANDLLNSFVKYVPVLYSEEFLVYNVHNLLHLSEDVLNFGPLDSFSAFPFENFMSKIKRLVRSHNMPLEQVAKRLGEKSNEPCSHKTIGVVKKRGVITKIPFNVSCTLSIAPSDSCFVTFNGDVVVVKSIETYNDSYELKCTCFLYKTDFYKNPIESSKLGIYKVSGTYRRNVYLSSLHKKCLLLPNFSDNDGSFICIPFVSSKLHH